MYYLLYITEYPVNLALYMHTVQREEKKDTIKPLQEKKNKEDPSKMDFFLILVLVQMYILYGVHTTMNFYLFIPDHSSVEHPPFLFYLSHLFFSFIYVSMYSTYVLFRGGEQISMDIDLNLIAILLCTSMEIIIQITYIAWI